MTQCHKKREEWHFNGFYHRVEGPCYIFYNKSGKIEEEYWYSNGNLHRVDGPAYNLYNKWGRTEEWYLNGKESTHKEWLVDNNLYKPYNTWTDEEKVLWRLSWL